MKVKVLKTYKDKHTKNLHKINEIIEMTAERFEEINSTSQGVFVEEIKEAKVEKQEPKKPTSRTKKQVK